MDMCVVVVVHAVDVIQQDELVYAYNIVTSDVAFSSLNFLSLWVFKMFPFM